MKTRRIIITVAVEGCEYTGTSELIVGAELRSEDLGEFAAKAVKELMALMPLINKMEIH